MKEKKKIVYTIIILLGIFGLIALKVGGNFVHKNEIANKKTYSGSLTSSTLGNWEVTNSWVDLSSNNNVTIDGEEATIHATTNFIEDNEITYRMNVTYEGGTASSNFTKDTEYYEGFVLSWRINKFPFLTRDSDISESDYTWTEDVNNNRIKVEKVIEGDDTEIFAYISFNSLVHKSKQRNEQFAWRLNTDQWPYQIEIYNAEELDAANDIDTTFDVTFQVVPSLLQDNLNTAESFEPEIYLENADDSLADIPRDSNISYHAKVEGKLAIENIVKADPIVYEEWNSNWGTNPDGGNSYFYVLYSVDASINATKPFNNNPNIIASLIPDTKTGELVAYSDGTNFAVGDTDDFVDDNTFAKPDNDWNFSYYALLSNIFPTTTDFTRTFVVKYPKPSSGTVTTNFSLTIEATGDEELTTESKTVNWTASYTSSGVVTPTYPSGYNNNITVDYSDTSSGIGAVNKINKGDVDFSLFIEPTSAEINKLTSEEKVKAFNNWNATNEGANSYKLELATNKLVLDSSYDVITSENILGNTEYNIVSISPEITKYDYTLYNNRYYLTANNNDTTGTLKVYGEINNTWEELGTITVAENINYTASNTKTTSVSGVTVSNPIILPSGTTNIRIEYNGKKAAVYIGLHVNLKLLNAAKNKVNSIYNSNNSVVLRQYANSKVNNDNKDTKYKDMNLTKLESRSSITHTSTKVKNSTDNTISYESKVIEEIEYNSTTSQISLSSIKEQKNAKFYILLPLGSTLVENSITIKDINGNDIPISSTPNPNYQNTNRILMTVPINNPNSNTKVQNNKLLSGYTLNYQVVYPHTSNRDYGNVVNSDLAYYSEATITAGYSNASSANSNLFSSNLIKTIMNNLETKESSYLFKYNTITLDPVATSLGTLKTQVKNSNDSEHKDNTTVKIGNTYQYKIEYSYSDPLTEMSNLVIYTSLENAFGSNSYWQGTLSSVDTSPLQTLGISSTVYYSETSNLDLTNDRNLDLTKSDTWSSDTPTNMANVKAVAIDCSATNIVGVKIPVVYLNMIATLNKNDVDKSAYNNSLIKFNTLGEVKKITSNTASIKLENANLSLDVIPKESLTGTEYGKGTQSSYAPINETLGYLYHITNIDDVSYNNVNINTKISNNLTINQSGIRYYTDINNPHNLDSSITYTNTNNNIDLNITSITADTDLYIYIPVQIDAVNLTEENSKFTSVSSINKLSGKAFNTTEIKTYNRANIPSISAVHSTKTIYNNNIFSSEDTYVNRGETITNMIKVTNDVDVEAKNITIIETIPSGVTIDDSSITNSGVHSGNTITWTIPSLAASTNLELTYNMTIPNNATNNTYYTTSTKVEMLNPYDNSHKLVDKTLVYGTIVYRNVTDIKFTNTIEGALANKNKNFNYTLQINATSQAKGTYTPKLTVNGVTKNGQQFSIGEDGKATYNFTIAGEGELLITNIPGGYNFTINQDSYQGYTTSLIGRTITNMGISDSIDENTDEHLRTYSFLNTYSATGSYTPTVKVKYDQELLTGMFEVNMKINDATTSLTNSTNGNITFPTINYDNEVGTYNYTFQETRGTNDRILYDSTIYTAIVKVTDSGTGQLNTEINIYDSTGTKYNEIVFNNQFIKVGLLVKDEHTGDYINVNKAFDYKIIVDSAAPNASYKVTDNNSNVLEPFTTDDNGAGTYEISLKHNEFIVIEELPIGSNYIVEERVQEYYNSTIKDSDNTVEDGVLRTSGTIVLATTQVIYNNNYSTKANFAPKANIILKDKELENNEFLFVITDTSNGVTNGYTEAARNDADGNIYFSNITFTRPGTYTYEIVQMSSDNPNIRVDNNKLLLTLILEDNEDGTMSIKSTYKYLNGSTSFMNLFSELPFIDEDPAKKLNPNTADKTIYIILISIIAIIFIAIGRFVNVKKYKKI